MGIEIKSEEFGSVDCLTILQIIEKDRQDRVEERLKQGKQWIPFSIVVGNKKYISKHWKLLVDPNDESEICSELQAFIGASLWEA